jgi:hypothetical protein
MFTLKLKMTSFKFKNFILQNKWTLLTTMQFYKTKWLWMQKKTQTFTGVLVKRSYKKIQQIIPQLLNSKGVKH